MKKLYKIGCFIGGGLILMPFLTDVLFKNTLKVFSVDLMSWGYLILGVTFLINYFLCTYKEREIEFWWQNIMGVACIFLFIADAFSFNSWYLSLIVFLYVYLIMYFKYKKLSSDAKNFSNPKDTRDNWN